MAKALIDYSSIKMLDDDGAIVSEEFIEFAQPKEDLVPHKAGTSWHPILQRYLPDSIIDREMLVDESELFPNGEEDDDDPIIDVNGNIVEEQPKKEMSNERRDTMKSKVKIVRGDITTFRGDAIVNAANERMLGGGGVDGAIHRAAGPELLAECRKVAEVRPGVRCPTGEARITPGGRLIAKWVIHTVGPDCSGGMFAEAPELLANCYRNSLLLAAENGIRKIAFPSISTGVFDFPKDEAAMVAIGEIKDFLETHDLEVFFFGSPDTMEYYEKEAKRQGLR